MWIVSFIFKALEIPLYYIPSESLPYYLIPSIFEGSLTQWLKILEFSTM